MQSLANIAQPRNEETKQFLDEIKNTRTYVREGIVFKKKPSQKTEALGTIYQVCTRMVKEMNGNGH